MKKLYTILLSALFLIGGSCSKNTPITPPEKEFASIQFVDRFQYPDSSGLVEYYVKYEKTMPKVVLYFDQLKFDNRVNTTLQPRPNEYDEAIEYRLPKQFSVVKLVATDRDSVDITKYFK